MVRIDLGSPVYPAFVLKHIEEEFVNMIITAAFRESMGSKLPPEKIEIVGEAVSILVDDESAQRYKETAERFLNSMVSSEFWKGVFTTLVVLDSNPLLVQPLKNPRKVARCD